MLEARGVTFRHAGANRPLYRDFFLSVEAGERVALSAPSGFGKTTLCRMLAGYERPQSGEVLVDGQPLVGIRGACPVQLIGQHPERMVDPRMRMSAVLEEAGLAALPTTRSEASSAAVTGGQGPVALPGATPSSATPLGAASDDADERLLDDLGIQRRWLSRYPHELSGGELQRFCIARALAANPRYLVADEISTMLDALTQAQLWRFLLAEVESRHMGLVFVSHSPALTRRIATRVVDLASINQHHPST